MNHIIKYFVVGELATNCYVLTCNKTKKTAVIDPGTLDCQRIMDYINKNKLELEYVINTHGHADHIAGNNSLKKEYPLSKLLIHNLDKEMIADPVKNLSAFGGFSVKSKQPDLLLKDADTINLGELKLKVIHTPGHTQGSIGLLLEDNILFSGDTLFANSIGRTDLPGGYYNDIINSVKNKLFILSDMCDVYPGHGEPTTIGIEKRTNPFFN